MISLQLMRRFIAGLNCSSKNWPQEYVEQFSPLISHCSYNKGSLVTEAFEHSLSNSATQPLGVIKPLPPTHECALFPHEKEALLPIVQELVGHESYDILTLFQKCKAIFVRNFIIGSNGSRFTASSHVMAKHPNDSNTLYLARIEFFAKLDVKIHNSSTNCWIAAVSLYFQHEHKVWFGYPVEVWARSTLPDLFYIPPNSIVSQVVVNWK